MGFELLTGQEAIENIAELAITSFPARYSAYRYKLSQTDALPPTFKSRIIRAGDVYNGAYKKFLISQANVPAIHRAAFGRGLSQFLATFRDLEWFWKNPRTRYHVEGLVSDSERDAALWNNVFDKISNPTSRTKRERLFGVRVPQVT
jgi:hypothetical protein